MWFMGQIDIRLCLLEQTAYINAWYNTIKLHVQVFLKMNTWLFETCRRQHNWIKSLIKRSVHFVASSYISPPSITQAQAMKTSGTLTFVQFSATPWIPLGRQASSSCATSVSISFFLPKGKQKHNTVQEYGIDYKINKQTLYVRMYVWRKGKVYRRFWWGNLKERDHWGDQDVDGSIILRWIFRKWEGVVGTGRGWLRIWTGGGLLWVR